MQDTKKMFRKKIFRFKNIYKLSSDYFLIGVIIFIYSSKTFLLKSNSQFFRQNIRNTEKMLKHKIIYFKNIYNFGSFPFFHRTL